MGINSQGVPQREQTNTTAASQPLLLYQSLLHFKLIFPFALETAIAYQHEVCHCHRFPRCVRQRRRDEGLRRNQHERLLHCQGMFSLHPSNCFIQLTLYFLDFSVREIPSLVHSQAVTDNLLGALPRAIGNPTTSVLPPTAAFVSAVAATYVPNPNSICRERYC